MQPITIPAIAMSIETTGDSVLTEKNFSVLSPKLIPIKENANAAVKK